MKMRGGRVCEFLNKIKLHNGEKELGSVYLHLERNQFFYQNFEMYSLYKLMSKNKRFAWLVGQLVTNF